MSAAALRACRLCGHTWPDGEGDVPLELQACPECDWPVALPVESASRPPALPVDSPAAARRGGTRAAAPKKPQPIKIEHGELACWVTRTTARGRWLSQSYFDVPEEEYLSGFVTGARLARDLIHLLRTAVPDERAILDRRFRETVRGASEVPLNSGRQGAASGFMHTMYGVLLGGVLHAPADTFADEQLAEAERARDYFADLEKKERAAFVQRMKAARTAKRQRAAVRHLAAWSGIGAACQGERGAAA